MSIYYEVYAEIKVGDKWHFLGPYMKNRDGRFESVPLYWAQSAFCRVDDELQSYALNRGVPEDASQELLARFNDLDETMDCWGETIMYRDYYKSQVYAVDFERIVVPKVIRDRPFKHSGYVSKLIIDAFACHEVDEIEGWLTKEEYEALAHDDRCEYSYYEWNNSNDEYGIFSEIKKRVEYLKEWFEDGRWYSSDGFIYAELESAPIRLIICRE